jgi:hypothetical protein
MGNQQFSAFSFNHSHTHLAYLLEQSEESSNPTHTDDVDESAQGKNQAQEVTDNNAPTQHQDAVPAPLE